MKVRTNMRMLATALVVLSLTSGCASIISRSKGRPRLGDPQWAVIECRGEPQKRVDTPAGEVWIYEDGRTALLFDHDKKLKWTTKSHVGYINPPERVAATLTEGMTRCEVRERMGKPQTCFVRCEVRERMVTSDGEVWIYRGGEVILYFESNRLREIHRP